VVFLSGVRNALNDDTWRKRLGTGFVDSEFDGCEKEDICSLKCFLLA
jgi:hypothetical protein